MRPAATARGVGPDKACARAAPASVPSRPASSPFVLAVFARGAKRDGRGAGCRGAGGFFLGSGEQRRRAAKSVGRGGLGAARLRGRGAVRAGRGGGGGSLSAEMNSPAPAAAVPALMPPAPAVALNAPSPPPPPLFFWPLAA